MQAGSRHFAPSSGPAKLCIVILTKIKRTQLGEYPTLIARSKTKKRKRGVYQK
jgi:hypothetical protein